MKILVVDDSGLHQASARQTLKGNDLTIVGTYDEGYELLAECEASWEVVDEELKRLGFKNPYAKDTTNEEKAAYYAEKPRVKKELCPAPRFDAVLLDLLMPASKMTMGPEGMKFVGQEMPTGFALALKAVLAGAKFVAVVTDTNHHDHPASAMLDSISSRPEYGNPPRFVINGVKVGYYQGPWTFVDGTIHPDCNGTGSKEICYCVERNGGKPKPDCDTCKGAGKYCFSCSSTGKRSGKDWGKVLANLAAA